MKVECKYFGQVAEVTKLKSEWVEIEGNLEQLDELIKMKYPSLHFVNYQFAVNQKIAELNSELNKADKIALLPPFGGG